MPTPPPSPATAKVQTAAGRIQAHLDHWHGPDAIKYESTMANLADLRTVLAEREELAEAARELIEAEKGCDGPTCNIGGGLCSDCGDRSYQAFAALRAALAKLATTPTEK